MLRFVNICFVLALVALAYVIYEVKYQSRALDEDIAALRKEIETERDAVAVLRAEWSLLNRPERIERLAEKYLKLGAPRPSQLVTLDTVSDSDFERARVESAHQTLAEPPSAPALATPAEPPPAKAVATADEKPLKPLPPVTVSPPGE
jgi:cell division protein FtsL